MFETIRERRRYVILHGCMLVILFALLMVIFYGIGAIGGWDIAPLGAQFSVLLPVWLLLWGLIGGMRYLRYYQKPSDADRRGWFAIVRYVVIALLYPIFYIYHIVYLIRHRASKQTPAQ